MRVTEVIHVSQLGGSVAESICCLHFRWVHFVSQIYILINMVTQGSNQHMQLERDITVRRQVICQTLVPFWGLCQTVRLRKTF